eukprot:GFUD01072236.1.p2 GENE.GFUD01072236.1~~GFUD01072236.1.p2  ORF type:complete len:190 (-),score=62.86 GFUD01072236.1:417-986(-)
MEQKSADKQLRLILPSQEKLEDQEVVAVEHPEDVEDMEEKGEAMEEIAAAAEEDMVTGEEGMEEREEEDAATVAVEEETEKEALEEVQTATVAHVEVDNVKVVADMVAVDMDVEVVVKMAAIEEEEVDKEVETEVSTVRASRQPPIREIRNNVLSGSGVTLSSNFSLVGVIPHWWLPIGCLNAPIYLMR